MSTSTKDMPANARNAGIGSYASSGEPAYSGVPTSVPGQFTASGQTIDQAASDSATAAHLNRLSQNILIKEVSQYNKQANKEGRRTKNKQNQMDKQRLVQ